MKLFELTGIKHLKTKSSQDLLDFISHEFKMGRSKLRRLGKGSNAVVLTDGKQAIKFWHRDSAYEKFVEHCLANQNNPFLPKFLSKVKSLPLGINSTDSDGNELTGIRYVKMELLQPYDETDFQLLDPDVEGGGMFDIMEVMYMVDKFDSLDDIILELVELYMEENRIDDHEFIENIHHIHPTALEFIETLFSIKQNVLTDYGDMLDSGYDNLAMRGNQIVILDPVANDDDLTSNIGMFLHLT